MSVEVENVNSMTSGGGGSTSGTQTLTSELRQSTENALLTGADAVSAQTLTTLSTGDFCGALKKVLADACSGNCWRSEYNFYY